MFAASVGVQGLGLRVPAAGVQMIQPKAISISTTAYGYTQNFPVPG